MEKKNFDLLFLSELKKVEALDKKPTLLLQACCAPCSTVVLERLVNFFDVTIFFYNPNIYPEEEYFRRLDEIKKLIDIYDKNFKIKINLIVREFETKDYFQAVKGFENQKEGDRRCYLCYSFRLFKTAEFAKCEKFDYFCTTLSVSPHKNSTWINEIGMQLENNLQIKFLPADFKKRDGFKRSTELSKEFGLYRQNYCGCVFSLNFCHSKSNVN